MQKSGVNNLKPVSTILGKFDTATPADWNSADDFHSCH